MKNINIKVFFVLLLICIAQTLTSSAIGQNLDKRLWGEWKLESMEQTTLVQEGRATTQTILTKDIMTNKENAPEDLFLLLYMFEDKIGVSTTSQDFEYLQINDKGTFGVNQNHFMVSLYDRSAPTSFDFIYQIVDNKLILSIDMQSDNRSGVRYNRKLIYTKEDR